MRPDAVVNLPGSRHVVVDSKAPMAHFLQAHGETVDEVERAELLAAHATALRRHVEGLAAKAYWTAFTRSPEVVICFVPGEAILATALADDPGLYEHALSRKVVLASPGTLFAVLRTIGAIWQQDALEQNARELLAIGQDLHPASPPWAATSRRWASRSRGRSSSTTSSSAHWSHACSSRRAACTSCTWRATSRRR